MKRLRVKGGATDGGTAEDERVKEELKTYRDIAKNPESIASYGSLDDDEKKKIKAIVDYEVPPEIEILYEKVGKPLDLFVNKENVHWVLVIEGTDSSVLQEKIKAIDNLSVPADIVELYKKVGTPLDLFENKENVYRVLVTDKVAESDLKTDLERTYRLLGVQVEKSLKNLMNIAKAQTFRQYCKLHLDSSVFEQLNHSDMMMDDPAFQTLQDIVKTGVTYAAEMSNTVADNFDKLLNLEEQSSFEVYALKHMDEYEVEYLKERMHPEYFGVPTYKALIMINDDYPDV